METYYMLLVSLFRQRSEVMRKMARYYNSKLIHIQRLYSIDFHVVSYVPLYVFY